MKKSTLRKILATVTVMTLLMTTLIVGLVVPAGAEELVYSFTADDLTPIAQGEKADGDSEAVGTDGFFNIFYSAKTKVKALPRRLKTAFR